MKTTQVINLLSYYLIMRSDNNYQSHISYIEEKYNLYFNESPNKCDCIEHCIQTCNNDLSFATNFNASIKRWGIITTDKNFDIYYFTFYLCYFSKKNWTDDFTTPTKTDIVVDILTKYNDFFSNYNSLNDNILSYTLHPVLRNEIVYYQDANKRLFKLLKIKENILLNKINVL